MREKLQFIRNVSTSWISLALNVVVGIFLSPFILHRLGDTAFGIWVLIFSITGYYGLFDLGIRASVVRFVSQAVATNDRESLNRIISTSLFGYGIIGLVCIPLTLVLSSNISTLFQVPEAFHQTARWLMLICGTSMALSFPLGIVGGFLEGLQRFDILNWTNCVSTLTRAFLVVLALNHGLGLVTVAAITVITPLIASTVRGAIALRLCPVSLRFRYVSRSTLREIGSYGGLTFLILVAGRLKFQTDEIIIGSMLSAAAITYFNIGARVVDYAGEFVTSMAQVFIPMSSHSEAIGSLERLHKILLIGNRLCALCIFPISAFVIVLGPSIIEVWVGAKYIAPSYPVLVILTIATTLMYAQSASTRVLVGIGSHGTWATVTVLEGIANVILSMLLVRPFGIVGDAWGTTIPLLCTMLFFMPRHVCRRLGVSLGTHLRESYALPLVLCIPMVATMLLLKRWFVPHSFLQLALHFLTAALLYSAGLLWAFRSRRLTTLRLHRMGVNMEPAPLAGAAD